MPSEVKHKVHVLSEQKNVKNLRKYLRIELVKQSNHTFKIPPLVTKKTPTYVGAVVLAVPHNLGEATILGTQSVNEKRSNNERYFISGATLGPPPHNQCPTKFLKNVYKSEF